MCLDWSSSRRPRHCPVTDHPRQTLLFPSAVTMSPANRPFAAIVFDLDGTLVDSIGDIADGANKALAALGRPPRSVADYHKLYVLRS